MCLRLKTHVCVFHINMKQYVAKHRASKYVSRDLNNIIIVFIFITHQPNCYDSIGTISWKLLKNHSKSIPRSCQNEGLRALFDHSGRTFGPNVIPLSIPGCFLGRPLAKRPATKYTRIHTNTHAAFHTKTLKEITSESLTPQTLEKITSELNNIIFCGICILKPGEYVHR